MNATTEPPVVTLYTRQGCHLCDDAKRALEAVLPEFGARLRVVDIDGDPALRAQYDYEVPVICLGERKIAKHRVDPARLRRVLSEAQAAQK